MTGSHPHLTPDTLRRLTTDTDPWMSCDDCFDEIDHYIDGVLAGNSRISPRLRAHLIGCGACFEEAWSLLLLAAHDQGAAPGPALDRMRNDLDRAGLAWPDPPVNDAHRRML